jgi:hypothetical protein
MTERYDGFLILNDNSNEAFLKQAGGAQTLMQWDPSATGIYDYQQVTAAWQQFSDMGMSTDSPLTVFGFWNYPPGGTFGILYVVSLSGETE